jgi:outer membrane protein assembly factor BamB
MFALSPQGVPRWPAPSYGISDMPPAVDAQGNSYVSDSDGRCYASYDADGALRWSVPGAPDGKAPRLGPDGNLYVSENFGTNVFVLNPDTGAVIRQQSSF